MEIEDADGNRLSMVKKALISPLRDRWTVSIGDGPDLEIQGKVLDHEYTFSDGRTPVATVSKQWSRSPTPTAWRSPPTRIPWSCWRPRSRWT